MIGIEDEEFIRGKVPMTKQEIRILTLAKAQIGTNDFVVDVGAGTGSISIEAAQIASSGKVFAIEKNPAALELIRKNVSKFAVDNVIIVDAEAPNGFEKISRIDVAIIGGSGGNLASILDAVNSKLTVGGRIVVNAITIQTTATCLEYFKEHRWKYDAIQVQVNRLLKVGAYDMATALNPIYIITAAT